MKFRNMRTRLRNIKVRFGNMRAQKSFLEADQVKYLQLYLYNCHKIQVRNGKEIKHQ